MRLAENSGGVDLVTAWVSVPDQSLEPRDRTERGFQVADQSDVVVAHCSNGAERLQVELCLYRFDGHALSYTPESGANEAASGELTFL